MHIFLIGLTSTSLGGMEYGGNLGNYVIMEPLIKFLKQEFPEAKIVTSIQMSGKFCQKFGIESKREKRFWTYGKLTGFTTIVDVLKISIWSLFEYTFKINLKFILNSSLLLREINQSDVIIDFSGDIFGDNASSRKYLEGCVELTFSKILKKPTIMLIGSPGPFKKIWRSVLAKFTMNRLDLITTREPLSKDLLEHIGINNKKLISTACPSFWFEKSDSKDIKEILLREKIISNVNKPLIGLIISGWNMPKGPFDKWPRDDSEYTTFVKLIESIIIQLKARVCIMSHQNTITKEGHLTAGNDHRIINHLLKILRNRFSEDQVFTLKGFYDAATSKTIIGNFEILISGRIHGAVQGLSQCIPTVIIDYGHEPKAHKLKGFAQLVGMEKYLCNPRDSQDMINKVEGLWNNKEVVKKHLEKKIPEVKQLAKLNFELIKKVINDKKNN